MENKQEPTQSALDWLLEPADTGVRYLAMRDLAKASGEELLAAKKETHADGPIAAVLGKMQEDGYWVQPGAGYYPKYTGTVWSVILLAQLGADIKMDGRIATAVTYILEHNLTKDGHFTVNGMPSGTADCIQGNLCGSLLDLGCEDSRLDRASSGWPGASPEKASLR